MTDAETHPTTIRNLTPHDIVVVRPAGATPAGVVLAGTGGYEVCGVFTSEGVARAHIDVEGDGYVTVADSDGTEVSVVLDRGLYGPPVELPAPTDGVLLVVSTITAQAAERSGRTLDDLVTPGELVRDEAGRPAGCLTLRRAASGRSEARRTYRAGYDDGFNDRPSRYADGFAAGTTARCAGWAYDTDVVS